MKQQSTLYSWSRTVIGKSVRRVAHDASGQPLNFPERVWFPGEWEEVKAVCVSPMYYHFVPGYEEDEHYAGAEAWVRIESANDEQTIRKALENKGLRTDKLRFFLGGGNAFWFRDCGPICFYYGDDDKVAMLDFFYGAERSLDDLLPSMLHRQMGIPNYITSVIWEGGNCLVDGAGGLVTSSAVYRNNTGTTGPIIWDGKNYSTISYSKKVILN